MALTVDIITKVALRQLISRNVDAWRQNNVRAVRGRTFTGRIGVPDILGFYKYTGIMVGCECKADKDKLSQEQYGFLIALKRAGGTALVAMEDKHTGNVVLIDVEEALKEKPGLLRAG